MRLKEQRLWDSMHTHQPRGFWLQRIENGLAAGTPDVLSITKGHVAWVELKAVDSFPVRPKTPVLGDEGLNNEQRNWHLDWAMRGGISYVLIGIGRGAARRLVMISGAHANLINEFNTIQLLAWERFTWPEVFKELSGVKR